MRSRSREGEVGSDMQKTAPQSRVSVQGSAGRGWRGGEEGRTAPLLDAGIAMRRSKAGGDPAWCRAANGTAIVY